MALAVSRTGTIFKKRDRGNHKPETNKSCAVGTCQRTCDKPDRRPGQPRPAQGSPPAGGRRSGFGVSAAGGKRSSTGAIPAA